MQNNVRKSERSRALPSKYRDYILNIPGNRIESVQELQHSAEYVSSFNNVMQIHEPTSYSEACRDEGWIEAMQ